MQMWDGAERTEGKRAESVRGNLHRERSHWGRSEARSVPSLLQEEDRSNHAMTLIAIITNST